MHSINKKTTLVSVADYVYKVWIIVGYNPRSVILNSEWCDIFSCYNYATSPAVIYQYKMNHNTGLESFYWFYA